MAKKDRKPTQKDWEKVQFSDSSLGNITSWKWNFGDDSTSAKQNPGHTYINTGIFNVQLIVSGPGGSDTLSKADYITVVEEVPVARFGADPLEGVYPLSVQFTDSSDGVITSWAWDFGDKSTSQEQNPVHIYTAVGQYTVQLTVTGPGGSDVFTRANYIIVNELAPVAGFGADPVEGERPLIVQFSDSSSGIITDWLWDFGDSETSTEQNPQHIFIEADEYTVKLTVTGPGGGDSETKETYIIVTESSAVDGGAEVPKTYCLYHNFPNPFNPRTTIRFDVPKHASVFVAVYDMVGKQIAVLEQGYKSPGRYTLLWNGRNTDDVMMPSGMYILKMSAEDFTAQQKILLIK